MLRVLAAVACGLGAASAVLGQGTKAPAATQGSSTPTFAETIRARLDAAMQGLADDGDAAKASRAASAAFEEVIQWAPATDTALFADAAAAALLADHLQEAAAESRRELAAFLRTSPALATELAFTMKREDRRREAFAVLEALRRKHGDRIGAYPGLTTAICVVHDRPYHAVATRTKDSPGEPIDPVALFAYFVQNERKMLFGLNTLPAAALVFMVETTAGIDELAWALGRNAGDRNVGRRYNDLVYDTANYKFNKPKRIDSYPYSLQNIARVGGVCEEQAYYAAHVSRAIGVPAAMVYGKSSDVAHVWVAYLQQRGGGYVWNMDEGHYDEYEKLRGYVLHPQTGERMNDDRLAVTAVTFAAPAAARYGAAGLVEAALRARSMSAGTPKPPAATAGTLPEPRRPGTAAALELLGAALAVAPGWPEAWEAVGACSGGMTSADRTRWFDLLQEQCGRAHAGFAYSVIAAMAEGVADPKEQSRVWDWIVSRYRQKADLAGEARIRQGAMWERAGDKARAYEAYASVAREYPNDGTKAVEALERAEALLDAAGKHAAAVEMYKDAWRRMSRPETTSAWSFRQSNYYRVGRAYARALERLGRTNEAETIRRRLAAGEEKK